MKSKIKGLFSPPANKSSLSFRDDMIVKEWEVRPGGMLVQKRNSDSNQNPISIPMIKVRVKFGASCHEISISSQASFGELKKKLAEHTGLHPQDQKLIYRKKERDSKAYLDVAKVKYGSKILLVEDIASRERRCLEMLKSANIDKASKSLHQISLEVDKLAGNVTTLGEKASGDLKVSDLAVDNLIEILMSKLAALDEIVAVEGDLKQQKKSQEKRVQKCIETLDMLKLRNSAASHGGGKFSSPHKEISKGKMPMPMEKQEDELNKQMNATAQMSLQKQPLTHSDSFVVNTKWETFD